MLGRREFLTIAASSILPAGRRERLMVASEIRNPPQERWSSLRDSALQGACVILESGLAYASDAEIAGQRDALSKYFGIRIAPRLSRPASGFRYIRYHWPIEVLVREFSESAIIDPSRGDPIATVSGQVVAIRKQVGRGSVVYLGSALGPMLLAEDRQAAAWVRSVALHSSLVMALG
jgi:hypothetical protein